MPRYRTSLVVPGSPEKTFSYLAHFANAAEWDPGVVEAEQITDGSLAVGTRYRVVTSTLGVKSEMEYRVTELDSPHRIVLLSDSVLLRSEDEIRCEPSGSGTRVTYDANLRIKGLIGFPESLWQRAFDRIGDRAVAGLRAQLGG